MPLILISADTGGVSTNKTACRTTLPMWARRLTVAAPQLSLTRSCRVPSYLPEPGGLTLPPRVPSACRLEHVLQFRAGGKTRINHDIIPLYTLHDPYKATTENHIGSPALHSSIKHWPKP